jgi:hypothetical protein
MPNSQERLLLAATRAKARQGYVEQPVSQDVGQGPGARQRAAAAVLRASTKKGGVPGY